MSGSTPGRNDPCPCGSGRKYKVCCLNADRKARRAGASDGLRPEVIAAAREEDVWRTELVPVRIGFEDEPEARPAVALVVAGELVVHVEMHRCPSGEPQEVADLLWRAVEEAASRVGRVPRRLEARHEDVVRALATRLAPREVEVVRRDHLPPLDEAATELASRLEGQEDGEEPGRPCTSSAMTWAGWRLDPERIADLFEAVAAYHRARPWEHLDDEAPLHVVTPEGRAWAASVMGRARAHQGLSLYSELADRDRLVSAPWIGPDLTTRFTGRCLSISVERPDRLASAMRREVMRAGWPVAAPDAYPHLYTINTPGGGVSDADARDLAMALRALAAGSGILLDRFAARKEPGDPGDAVEWRDPGTGTVLRLDPAGPSRLGEIFRRSFDPWDEPPPGDGPGGWDDDWDRGWDDDPDGGWDDGWDEEADEASPWEWPTVLSPGAARGRGAEAGAALELMADESAGDREAERHRELLERYRDARSVPLAPEMAATFLAFLRERERIPLRALHERDLRVFLYRDLPQVTGPRKRRGAPRLDRYLLRLPVLKHFFRFLREEKGLECPWAEDLLLDSEAFFLRWDAYPGEGEEPDLSDLDTEEDPEAAALLAETAHQTVRWWDWDDELQADLVARVMVHEDSTADHRSWFESLPPEEWDLERELSRRWLLWREEAVAGGVIDPDEVYRRALEQQRAWETTPHPRIGGRTPLEALEWLEGPLP